MPMDMPRLNGFLNGLRQEAEAGRKVTEGRDEVWANNWKTYRQDYDYSGKKDWQFKIKMPEGPKFVDRFSSSIKDALLNSGRWYEIESDESPQLLKALRTAVDYVLKTGARSTIPDAPAHALAALEEVFKDGAMMSMAAEVKVEMKTDKMARVVERYFRENGQHEIKQEAVPEKLEYKQVQVVPVDPRFLWFDPSGRGLYRVRRMEWDYHTVQGLKSQKDNYGKSVWKADAIDRLVAGQTDPERAKARGQSTGTGTGGVAQDAAKGRKVVQVDEWYFSTLINDQGEEEDFNQFIYQANEKEIIRGPEFNPYMHGEDWVVSTPLVRVPHTVYGKSYMEEFEPVLRAFTNYTNLILDAGFLASQNAFAGDRSILKDPNQLNEGFSPGRYFDLEDGEVDPKKVFHMLQLGQLAPETLRVWEAMRGEAQEGASLNEIMLGNLPQRGERTATEISSATEAGSAFLRSILETVELYFLSIILKRILQTILQIWTPELPKAYIEKLPPEVMPIFQMDMQTRLRLIMGTEFRVEGLSSILRRKNEAQRLLAVMDIMHSRDFMQQLLQQTDPMTLLKTILKGFGIREEDFLKPPQQTGEETADPGVDTPAPPPEDEAA